MTKTKTTAMAELAELEQAVADAQAKLANLRYEHEAAIHEPAQARNEFSKWLDAVYNGHIKDDPKRRKELQEAITTAEERIAEDPRQGPVVLDIQAQMRAIERNELRPAQRAVQAFVREERDRLAAELLARAYAAQDAVLEAKAKLADAMRHHEAIRTAWTPYLNAWSEVVGGNPVAELPPYHSELREVDRLTVPAPVSLIRGDERNQYGVTLPPDAIRPELAPRGNSLV